MNVNSFAALEALSGPPNDKGGIKSTSGASKRSRQRKTRQRRKASVTGSAPDECGAAPNLESTAEIADGEGPHDRDEESSWQCQRCTYINLDSRRSCSVCSEPVNGSDAGVDVASVSADPSLVAADHVHQAQPFVLVRRKSRTRRRASQDEAEDNEPVPATEDVPAPAVASLAAAPGTPDPSPGSSPPPVTRSMPSTQSVPGAVPAPATPRPARTELLSPPSPTAAAKPLSPILSAAFVPSPTLSPMLSPTLSPKMSPEISREMSPKLSPKLSPKQSPTLSPTFSHEAAPLLRPAVISGGPQAVVSMPLSQIQSPERVEHQRYMYGFRTTLCHAYLEKRCPLDAYVCFECHAKPPRRRPRLLSTGEYTYAPTRCRYMQTTHGKRRCPQGDSCRYAHSTEEMIYHPLVYKTQLCPHAVNAVGVCTGFGMHCAKAHSRDEQRHPLSSHGASDMKLVAAMAMSPASGTGMPAMDSGLGMRRDDPGFYMLFYKTDRCPHKSCPRTCERFHNMKERRRSPRFFYYSEQPCPYVKSSGATKNWRDPSRCSNGDHCRYAHTLLEQMYHPHIYKTSPCNNYSEADPSRCTWGQLCTHAHGIADMQRQARALATLERDLAQPDLAGSAHTGEPTAAVAVAREGLSPVSRSPTSGRSRRTSPRGGRGHGASSPSPPAPPHHHQRGHAEEVLPSPSTSPAPIGFSPARSRYALPSLSNQIWHPTPDEDQVLLVRHAHEPMAPVPAPVPVAAAASAATSAPASELASAAAAPPGTPSYSLWTPMAASVPLTSEWAAPGLQRPQSHAVSPPPQPSHPLRSSRSASPSRLHDLVAAWRLAPERQAAPCVACRRATATLSLAPCSHRVCRVCLDERPAREAAVCPICRLHISGLLRITH